MARFIEVRRAHSDGNSLLNIDHIIKVGQTTGTNSEYGGTTRWHKTWITMNDDSKSFEVKESYDEIKEMISPKGPKVDGFVADVARKRVKNAG